MSYIGINGIPLKWNLQSTMKTIASVIRGNFTTLNFANNRKNGKTLFIQLSKRLNPYEVVRRFTSKPIKKHFFKAYVLDNVPPSVLRAKRTQLPLLIRRKFRIKEELAPELTLQYTHAELLTELQSKYTGLYNLSKKTGNKLLDNISETLFSRLTEIMDLDPVTEDNGFLLSQTYRKKYPHFGDFELILSTYKKLGGDTIDEAEFTAVSTHPYAIDNVPFDKVKTICNKYQKKICNEVTSHILSLPAEPDLNADTEDDIARKKVRAELKKIVPYLPAMLKQLIAQNFIPDKVPFHKVRIYGEPFIPSKESLSQLLKTHQAIMIKRSDRIFNMLKFKIPPQDYGSLLAMNGTVIGGAKLVIRSSDIPLYIVPREMIKKMNAHFGVKGDINYPADDNLDKEMLDQDIGDENFDEENIDEEELEEENWVEDM